MTPPDLTPDQQRDLDQRIETDIDAAIEQRKSTEVLDEI